MLAHPTGSSLTPRSFTPYSRRLSMSPGPHLKAPVMVNQEVHVLQRSVADLASGQERVSKLVESEHEQRISGICALQMQVDRLMSSIDEIKLVQEEMKKELSIMKASKLEPSDEDLSRFKQELFNDSLKAAEEHLAKEAKRSVSDAICQQLVKEHMQQLDEQVRELSQSFKPMISRIAQIATPSASEVDEFGQLRLVGQAEEAAASSASEAKCEETTEATSLSTGTRSQDASTEITEDGDQSAPKPASAVPAVALIPIQRRSSAPSLPGFYPVAMMPQQTMSPTSRQAGTPRSMAVRQVHQPGQRQGRSSSMHPSTMIWGGSARVPPRNFAPESGVVLPVRSVVPPVSGAAGVTMQEANRMNAKDQEQTRLEAMRLAVASARPEPPLCTDAAMKGVRMVI